MNEIPCKNCITLGICKSYYTENKRTILLMAIRKTLETKCCILKEWMLDENTSIYSEKCERFHIFFNPDHVHKLFTGHVHKLFNR